MWTLPFLGKMKGLAPLCVRVYAGAALAWHAFGGMRDNGAWDGGKAWVASRARTGGWAEALLYAGLWIEFLASCALLLGLFTRWCALALVGVTVFVLLKVHRGAGLEAQEVWIARGAACLVAAFLGPGSLSLDRIFFGKKALDA